MNQISSMFGGDASSPQQINIPPFLSSGGITPQQQSLADLAGQQGFLNNAQQYGGEGLGDSTMTTQGAEGVANTKAQSLGQMSDADQTAMYDLYKNQVGGLEQDLQNQITLSNQQDASSLSSLAAAGQLIGSGLGTGTQSGLQTTPA